MAPATVEHVPARAADGITLAATAHGSGPALLMIPGLGATRRVYAPLVPLLAGRHRVIVFDPRGVGDSDITDGPYSMRQLADDACCVLDAAGEDTAIVFGASMGGMVAQHVGLDHGERVGKLILACTSPGSAHAVPADRDATRALLGKGATTPADAYRLATTVLYTPAFRAAHADFVEAEIAERGRHPVRARAFSAQYQAVREHDPWDRLPTLRMPVLVLHGTEDAVIPPGNGEVLAERIPGARLVLLDGLGHLFWHEDPERAAQAILEFTQAG
ncbi:MAG TPA: alpha/beta hydrolase [Candidatus Angelobacter sp.]|nr:alpha/beta hydrolase [Candidatus Angelobacter sp.]